ncbi:unnamed protein product [Ceratitis capitata]|uniref:(Mediterranean fruit fly) hypothetical protein n=1 Tax=Ceratitis capitata TaxID=7213 RepID=A0A811TZN2_CERCA|nr:unnamed protein product [Ceratitis capitata]
MKQEQTSNGDMAHRHHHHDEQHREKPMWEIRDTNKFISTPLCSDASDDGAKQFPFYLQQCSERAAKPQLRSTESHLMFYIYKSCITLLHADPAAVACGVLSCASMYNNFKVSRPSSIETHDREHGKFCSRHAGMPTSAATPRTTRPD